MFKPDIYQARRKVLRERISDGVILLLGHDEAPRNYADNCYPFRQSSHLLYYTGLNRPQVALLIDPEGRSLLFGPRPHEDDVVWTGNMTTLGELQEAAGADAVRDFEYLGDTLSDYVLRGVRIHTLPPFRGNMRLSLMNLLSPLPLGSALSAPLTEAVIAQRAQKNDLEIAAIERALQTSERMHALVRELAKPGISELAISARMQALALEQNCQQAYAPIVSVHGEILHGHPTATVLKAGDLLMIDAGAEEPGGYASDITRTLPVGGRFSPQQREIYDIVLAAQLAAIETVGPGVDNREVHLAAARAISRGLVDLGLMRGDVDAIVAAGAHALFFCHGIGHMLGLDVHDMEDLGDRVGYGEEGARSEQFGLSFLRLARKLEPGYVLTIEPGIYFNWPLIESWRAEKRFAEFIAYDKLPAYHDFGGVRIEDDILVTDSGRRVLGPPIPKAADDVEAALGD